LPVLNNKTTQGRAAAIHLESPNLNHYEALAKRYGLLKKLH